MKFFPWIRSPQTAANFGLILLVMVINGVMVHRNAIALHHAHDQIARAHELIILSERILARQVDAETGVRGYALTGDDAFLQPFRVAIEALPAEIASLKSSLAEDALQIRSIEPLENSARATMLHLQMLRAAHAEAGTQGVLQEMSADIARLEMDESRRAISDFQEEVQGRLGVRTEVADRQLYTILAANLCVVCVGLLLSAVAWRLIDAQVRRYRAAETKADAERENLLVTLNSIGDAVVVTDAEGRVQLMNPVAEHLLESSAATAGKWLDSVFVVVNEHTLQPVPSPVTELLELGAIVGETRQRLLLRPGGTHVPIELNAAPIRNRDREITGVILVFRDCSERRRFEQHLKAREQHFRRMVETPLIGIAVCTLEGRFLLEANDTFLNLLGRKRRNQDGEPNRWDGTDTQQSLLGRAALAELRQTGICRPFEKDCVRRDGTVVPVLISANRLSDEEDRIIIFVTDLSSSKQSEAELRESESRFLILSESMPQMAWVARPDGQLEYVNRTFVEYSGLAADDLKGTGWTTLLHPDDQQMYADAWNEAMNSAQPFEAEYRLRHSAGSYRWHLTRALPMYNEAGVLALWVGTNTDIHDQKEVEVLLKEEHRRKDQFLAILAHELRNPLAPLGNAVEVLSASPENAATLPELIPIMKRQVRQLTRLIDDLLDVARITQGRITLRRERILVSTVTAAAVEAVQPWITEARHELTVQIPDEPLWIDADAARLSQILTNLLQNAAKYTPPCGRIALTVEATATEVQFRIRDSGQGIEPAMLAQIFDLFMQVHAPADRTPGGLGIGLSLVRTLVELHGGTVTAISEGPGTGSEFHVRLPREPSPPAESHPNGPQAAGSPADGVRTLRVLVVDDVRASARTLALMLNVLGQDVEMAFDGPSALAKLREQEFDLVFLDIAMPDMDGLEVAEQIRADSKLTHLKLVALTGFGQEDDRLRSLEAGFDEHLIKPASLDLLTEILRDASPSDSVPER